MRYIHGIGAHLWYHKPSRRAPWDAGDLASQRERQRIVAETWRDGEGQYTVPNAYTQSVSRNSPLCQKRDGTE